MKKLNMLAFALLMLAANQICAQTEKGNLIIGGTAGAYYHRFDANNWSRGIYLDPKVGYFILPNFAVGLSLPMNINRIHFFNSNGNGFSFGLGPFVRYYVPLGKAYWLTELNYKVGIGKIDHSSDIQASDGSLRKSLKFGTGVAFFVNKNLSVETLVNFEKDLYIPSQRSVNLSLGLQYYLRRNRE